MTSHVKVLKENGQCEPVDAFHPHLFIRDKYFGTDRDSFFASYQGIRVTGALFGTSQANMPLHLTDDRSSTTLVAVAQQDFGATAVEGKIILSLRRARLFRANHRHDQQHWSRGSRKQLSEVLENASLHNVYDIDWPLRLGVAFGSGNPEPPNRS